MTSPAVLVSPMRPVVRPGQPPLQPDARGVLFVAADHQHWYMSLQGLQPVPAGQVYKLWFVADRAGERRLLHRPARERRSSSAPSRCPPAPRGPWSPWRAIPRAAAPTGPRSSGRAPPYEIS